MMMREEKTINKAKESFAEKFAKTSISAFLFTALFVSLLASGQVLAEGAKTQDERFGGYTLADESMLGRYGDVNDEWVQSASSDVNMKPVMSSKPSKKSSGRLGAYSTEDNAMLGRYGDHNDE